MRMGSDCLQSACKHICRLTLTANSEDGKKTTDALEPTKALNGSFRFALAFSMMNSAMVLTVCSAGLAAKNRLSSPGFLLSLFHY